MSARPDDPPGDAERERYYRDRSLWLSGVEESLTPRQALAGDIECDVAIVGAGFTGLWAAYYLAVQEPALRVVVLEREIAGFGPSGRNGGWVSAGIAGRPRAYGERPGSDAIRRATRETHAAVDEIGRVAEQEGIDCGFRKAGAMTIATTEPQRARLKRLLVSSATTGRGDRALSYREIGELVRIPGVLAATFTPHAARIDPARLTRGLARACERLGVTIHERSEAQAIGTGIVRCRNGTVRSETVLSATESYTTQMPGQRMRYLPLYSMMVATEPLPPDVWQDIGWPDGLLIGDLHHLFFYAQRTTDGRIAIGGRGAPYRLRQPLAERNERSDEVRARLVQTVQRHFPAAAGAAITHHWGGPIAVARDWSMSVTFDPSTRLGAAGGYAGHGVAATNIAGRTLAELALGARTARTTLPWVQHTSRRWEPEPLRFMASQAIVRTLNRADEIEEKTWRSARRVQLLAPFMPSR